VASLTAVGLGLSYLRAPLGPEGEGGRGVVPKRHSQPGAHLKTQATSAARPGAVSSTPRRILGQSWGN
jgi:hypothetical protein